MNMDSRESLPGNHRPIRRSGCSRIDPRVFFAFLFILLLCFAAPLPVSPVWIGVAENGASSFTEEAIIDTGLLTISIHTKDGENPTFVDVDPPEGCVGASIRDNTYVKGYCEITNMDSGRPFASGMKLKVRGNASARNAGPEGKLPYKLVLNEAVDLFGNGHRDNRYVLLAGAGENLNTLLGFWIGQYAGMDWTPECRYVNLLLNGDYRGIYLLVRALDGTSLPDHIGPNGFMIECDAYWWKEDVYFRTDAISYGMAYTIKFPDENRLTDARLQEIIRYMEAAESEVLDYSNNDLIDERTFVAWIITRDITGSVDPCGANIYYYLENMDAENPATNKLYMGPLWDFDSTFELDNQWSYNHFSATTYFPYQLSNEGFASQYIDRYQQISPYLCDELETMLHELEDTAGGPIDASRQLDAARWNRPLILLEAEAEEKLDWLKDRIEWMKMELDAQQSGQYLKGNVYVAVSDGCKTMDIWLPDDGYERVSFPVWSDEDGQDDLIWWEAQCNEDGIWECQVDLSQHHSKGVYYIHAYDVTEDSFDFIGGSVTFVSFAVESEELETAAPG